MIKQDYYLDYPSYDISKDKYFDNFDCCKSVEKENKEFMKRNWKLFTKGVKNGAVKIIKEGER